MKQLRFSLMFPMKTIEEMIIYVTKGLLSSELNSGQMYDFIFSTTLYCNVFLTYFIANYSFKILQNGQRILLKEVLRMKERQELLG
jgi:hypothetical protein